MPGTDADDIEEGGAGLSTAPESGVDGSERRPRHWHHALCGPTPGSFIILPHTAAHRVHLDAKAMHGCVGLVKDCMQTV